MAADVLHAKDSVAHQRKKKATGKSRDGIIAVQQLVAGAQSQGTYSQTQRHHPSDSAGPIQGGRMGHQICAVNRKHQRGRVDQQIQMFYNLDSVNTTAKRSPGGRQKILFICSARNEQRESLPSLEMYTWIKPLDEFVDPFFPVRQRRLLLMDPIEETVVKIVSQAVPIGGYESPVPGPDDRRLIGQAGFENADQGFGFVGDDID